MLSTFFALFLIVIWCVTTFYLVPYCDFDHGESSETDPFKVYVFGENNSKFQKKKLIVFTERNATKDEDIHFT